VEELLHVILGVVTVEVVEENLVSVATYC
jgi:hypothetical protein